MTEQQLTTSVKTDGLQTLQCDDGRSTCEQAGIRFFLSPSAFDILQEFLAAFAEPLEQLHFVESPLFGFAEPPGVWLCGAVCFELCGTVLFSVGVGGAARSVALRSRFVQNTHIQHAQV